MGLADLLPHGDSRQQERRQYPRTRISWLIVVYAGSSRFLSRSLDISPFGAKVRTDQRTQDGHVGAAQSRPAGGLPLRVGATVGAWMPTVLPFSSAVASSIASSARPITLLRTSPDQARARAHFHRDLPRTRAGPGGGSRAADALVGLGWRLTSGRASLPRPRPC